MMNPSTSRKVWPDVMRVIATFFVVMNHCGGGGFGINGWPGYSASSVAVAVFTTLAKPAVLWFFMLSGYLLLGKQESLGDFFKKRFSKVLLPLVIFSAIYILADGGLKITGKMDAYHCLTKGAHFHLWFLHALLVCYLAIPVLRKVCVNTDLAIQIYLLLLWLFFARWMPLENRILGVTDTVFGIEASQITLYAGYLLLGRLLGRVVLVGGQFWAVLILWIASSVAMSLAAVSGPPWETFGWGYASPLLMLSASAGFLLLKHIAEIFDGAPWLCRLIHLAPLSLGVYLIHPLLLEHIPLPSYSGLNSWIEIPLKTLTVFSAASALVYGGRLLKLGRWIMP